MRVQAFDSKITFSFVSETGVVSSTFFFQSRRFRVCKTRLASHRQKMSILETSFRCLGSRASCPANYAHAKSVLFNPCVARVQRLGQDALDPFTKLRFGAWDHGHPALPITHTLPGAPLFEDRRGGRKSSINLACFPRLPLPVSRLPFPPSNHLNSYRLRARRSRAIPESQQSR